MDGYAGLMVQLRSRDDGDGKLEKVWWTVMAMRSFGGQQIDHSFGEYFPSNKSTMA